jgi:YceG-like family
MTDSADWRDPYTGDEEAALAREQRRAEREARRRERRGALGERVRDVQAQSAPPAPAPTADKPTAPAPVDKGPAASPATPLAAPPTAEQAAATPPPEQPPPRRTGPPQDVAHRRRLWAVIGLAALAFVVLVVAVAAKKLGGDDEAPVQAPKPAKTSEVTIPEGYARDQVAEVAREAGIEGDYMDASESSKGFDSGKYGAESPQSLEGFLFPATYEEFKDAKAADLVNDQLEAFEQNVKQVDFGYAESKNLTEYDVLIIASMIEREVQVPEERDDVAAVIYNRLRAGMPLGIDATIRYAVQNFDKPLTQSELAVDSPYNTRTNTGLPPGPIGSPGIDAIDAAANPAKVDYLYYVVKPGTCGEHVFTDSEQEFQQAAAEYQAALEAKGSSPTEC